MARILFATVPIAGHVLPFVGVARALHERGHTVTWYAGRKFAQVISETGARFLPYCHARDFDDAALEEAFPGRDARSGLAQLKFDMMHVFADQALGQLADLELETRSAAADLIIADPFLLGALLLRERSQVPLLMLNVVANPLPSRDTAPFGLGILPSAARLAPLRNRLLHGLMRHVLLRDVQAHWATVQRSAGVRRPSYALEAPLRASVFALPTVPGFEYPRTDLPANVRFVGALHSPAPAALAPLPFAAELEGPRPVVHVTQGTVANSEPTLIRPSLAALADEDVLVVVATGGRSAAQLGLGRIPTNARIAAFVSYPMLLPKTAVMITNGGYGGVQLALSHGVPLLVWGTTEDKPETAARVAWTGAGLRLSGPKPHPKAIRAAVRTLMCEPSYASRAQALAAEFNGVDGVAEVVILAEALARGSLA